MRLGPTILGGIIGAAVGVAVHVLLATGLLGMQTGDASWFAIVTGLLTGFGVRQANKGDMGRVSYLRGAVAGLLALGAIYLTFPAMQKALEMKSQADAEKAKAAASATAAEVKEVAAEPAGDEAAEASATEPAKPADAPKQVAGPAVDGNLAKPPDFSTWQFAFMAIGAFVAYELARGTGHGAGPSRPREEPIAMDPSN